MSVVNFKNDDRIVPEHREILRDFCKELGGDLVQLANRLGVKVFQDNEMHHSNDGYLVHDERCGSASGYKVVLNASKPIQRQKFTLAHELGHFVLHRNSPELKRKRKKSAKIIEFATHRSIDDWEYDGFPVAFEREANSFAVSVMLPVGPLKRSPEFQNGAPVALADRLGFSKSMVTRRFEEVYFAF